MVTAPLPGGLGQAKAVEEEEEEEEVDAAVVVFPWFSASSCCARDMAAVHALTFTACNSRARAVSHPSYPPLLLMPWLLSAAFPPNP